MSASQKLSHLLQLADQGPAMRAALAEEVAELLTAWPADYPDSMKRRLRGAAGQGRHDVDADTRARLRVQLVLPIRNLRRACLPRESAGQTSDRRGARRAKACPMRWRKAWAWTQ